MKVRITVEELEGFLLPDGECIKVQTESNVYSDRELESLTNDALKSFQVHMLSCVPNRPDNDITDVNFEQVKGDKGLLLDGDLPWTFAVRHPQNINDLDALEQEREDTNESH